MPSRTQSPTKQRLTLAQLTSYDDILTDALVDHVYYWTTIRKNKNAYHSSRGLREEDITSILQKHVIVEEDVEEAERLLLQLPGLKKFSANLQTEKEKDNFRRHLRKYINIYLPDCAFEVASTNRYTLSTHEAAVTARKYIRKGEVVKYLCGVQITMTEEEEEFIKESRRDFSIVCSGRNRNQRPSLFLGPGRFANHDCDANARLMTSGKDGMEIIALRPIEIGDEITVSYGDHFFDEDNSSCLCKTCEDLCRNGWTAEEPEEDEDDSKTPQPSIEETAPRSLRRRRHISHDSSRASSMAPDVIVRPQISKRTPKSLSRFKHLDSPLGRSPSSDPTPSPLKRKRESEPLTPATPSRRKRSKLDTVVKLEEPMISLEDVPSSDSSHDGSVYGSCRDSLSSPLADATSTDDTSVDDDTNSGSDATTITNATSIEDDTVEEDEADAIFTDQDTIIVDPMISHPTISKLKRVREAQQKKPLQQAEAGATLLVGSSTSLEHPAIQEHDVDPESELSDLDSDMELDDENMIVRRKIKTRRRKTTSTPIIDLDHAPSIRVPGDYILNATLLAVNASAWINCKICEEPFVQGDAYFTRSSCPRCERHSKLYGYMWPKTEPEGEDDEEERVLDHRTIHRFLDPHEEKITRKIARAGSRGVTMEVAEEEEQEEEPVKRRTMRPSRMRKTM